MHDWTLSNELMAKVLADKGTITSSCSCATPSTSIARPSRNPAGALEWLWKDYPIP